MEAKTKQNLASALCKHLSVSPEGVELDQKSDDIKSLYSHIVHLSGKLITQDNNNNHDEEVMKWIAFAESFPVNDSQGSLEALTRLNQDLLYKSVILGNGLTPSAADVILFSVIHSFVIGLSDSEREKLPHVIRWMDYIQSKEDFGNLFEKIPVQMDAFEPPHFRKDVGKLEVDSVANKNVQSTKNAEKPETDPNKKKSDVGKKGNKEPIQEKKTTPETAAAEKDKDVSVSLLNIQVGLIRRAWKHPSAESLLVEEIDVGEAKLRQVVSGLAKYCSPDELTNCRVVLITNVKPGKLRDVMSEGLVLCASNEDHTVVEPLLPPEGAKIGERILFSGVDGKPEDVLNPKKKQLEKITPHLFTDDNGVATYKGIPFMTSGGPCTSTIPKASIK